MGDLRVQRGSTWRRPTVVEVVKQFVARSKHRPAVSTGAAVDCRQVNVAGDGITEPAERHFTNPFYFLSDF